MYILIAIIIAIIIVILYYFVFPGIFLINIYNLSGYWTDLLGNIYKITPTNRTTFTINLNEYGKINGTIFNNVVNIYNRNLTGKYSTKTNTIIFNNGEEWYKTTF